MKKATFFENDPETPKKNPDEIRLSIKAYLEACKRHGWEPNEMGLADSRKALKLAILEQLQTRYNKRQDLIKLLKYRKEAGLIK